MPKSNLPEFRKLETNEERERFLAEGYATTGEVNLVNLEDDQVATYYVAKLRGLIISNDRAAFFPNEERALAVAQKVRAELREKYDLD
jgi:hypothetical protein